MSWPAYRENLINRGDIAKAAIFGQNGGEWTTSEGLSISQQEIAELIKCMNAEKTETGTIVLGNIKWMASRLEKRVFYGAKGKENICVCATNQALVIAISDKDAGHTPNNANNHVQNMADFLQENGY